MLAAAGAPEPLVGATSERPTRRLGMLVIATRGDADTNGGEMGPFLVISLGGILGANARYLVSLYIAERFGTAFPYGTFLINVTGSLVIGFFLTLATERLPIDPLWRLFFATGFLGAYTTFSTYTYEAALLLRAGSTARRCSISSAASW